jgi:hypothetical protein
MLLINSDTSRSRLTVLFYTGDINKDHADTQFGIRMSCEQIIIIIIMVIIILLLFNVIS